MLWKKYFIRKLKKVFTMMNWKDDELWEAVSRRDVTGVRGALRKVTHPPCPAGRWLLFFVYV